MDPVVTASGIAAFAAIVGAILSFVNSRRIRRVEINVDGKLQALVDATARAERAEGQAEGRLVEAAAVAALGAVAPVVTPHTTDAVPGDAIRVIVEGEVAE